MTSLLSVVPVDSDVLDVHLPGWDYADGFEITTDGAGPDSAMTALRCLLGPGRGHVVLQARDHLVGAVGLKPAVTGGDVLFPVLAHTPRLAVAGLDDSHLDFRILVSVDARHVRCVTAVRRHNALGRAYFVVVRPFHRRLVPYLLRRAARRSWLPVGTAGADTRPAGGVLPTHGRAGDARGPRGGVRRGLGRPASDGLRSRQRHRAALEPPQDG